MWVMKKIIYLLALVVSLQFTASAQSYEFKNLVGNWRNKEGVGLEIVDSSRIYVVHGEQRKQVVSYSFDFNSNPAKFNFVIKDNSGVVNIKSMLLFLNDNLVQWQVIDSYTKPANYTDERRDVLILRKIEESAN